MAKMHVVYWRDIPAQVIVKKGRTAEKILLPARFQEAIDRAAMRAGKGSSDAYLEDWHREASAVPDDDMKATAEAKAAELEALWDDEKLERVTKAGGKINL